MESTLFDSLIDLNESFQKTMPLAAIWFDHPISIAGRRTARIEAGDRLRIENDAIVDINTYLPYKQATHEVLGCYGNISNTVLYFDLKNLETNELFTLKIK